MSMKSVVGAAVLVLTAWGFVATGCSSSSSSVSPAGDVSSLCQRLVYCGKKDSTGAVYTQATCEANFKGWIMPGGCLSAFQSATCADVTASPAAASLKSACFPPCAATTCSADQSEVTICTTSGGETFSCTDICARNSQTYIGICGTSANGKTSPTPVCWCQ